MRDSPPLIHRHSVTAKPHARGAIRRAGLAFVLFALGLVASCNSSSQMPSGTQLRIFPTEKTIRVNTSSAGTGDCSQTPGYYQDVVVQLVLETPDSTPVGDANIYVYADYSGNTAGTREVMSLYRDINQNGVIDSEDIKVSSADDSALQVRSDRWHGNALVLLRIDLSCPFRGYVTAYAGATAVSMAVSVVDGDVGASVRHDLDGASE